MSTKFSIATSPHPDNSLVTKKKTKSNSSWKVSIQFSIAINPNASHSPIISDPKKNHRGKCQSNFCLQQAYKLLFC